MMYYSPELPSRRHWLRTAGAGFGMVALAGLLGERSAGMEPGGGLAGGANTGSVGSGDACSEAVALRDEGETDHLRPHERGDVAA
jgi:hypothetical protein